MGSRVQTRRDDAEKRALARLTRSYLGVFGLVIAALSAVAYAFLYGTYRSIVAPALDTPEGRAGLSAAMRPAAVAIASADVMLLAAVGVASFALARAALHPLVVAREREERFSADVAHELRTPLAAIASLAETGVDAGPAGARTALDAIARRALECGALVGDLLTLARTNDGEALHCEPVDLAMLACRVCTERAAVTPHLRIDFAGDGAIVDGDERRLIQLVRNLIDNAAAHARSRVCVAVAARGGTVHLRVEDDGPGVAIEMRPVLFERFAKGANSGGSGLGLAICRWVARAHRGDIVFSGGSTFDVTLPGAR